MDKRKLLILILPILLILIIIIGKNFSQEIKLPPSVADNIKFDYEVIDHERKLSFQDSPNWFVLIELNPDDLSLQVESFKENRMHSLSVDTLENFKLNFGDLKNNNVFKAVSTGYYVSNYYIDKGSSFVAYFILSDTQIAIFYY